MEASLADGRVEHERPIFQLRCLHPRFDLVQGVRIARRPGRLQQDARVGGFALNLPISPGEFDRTARIGAQSQSEPGFLTAMHCVSTTTGGLETSGQIPNLTSHRRFVDGLATRTGFGDPRGGESRYTNWPAYDPVAWQAEELVPA